MWRYCRSQPAVRPIALKSVNQERFITESVSGSTLRIRSTAVLLPPVCIMVTVADNRATRVGVEALLQHSMDTVPPTQACRIKYIYCML